MKCRIQNGPRVLASDWLLLSVWSIWFVWFVLFIWLNQTSRINQMNQTDQINLSRVAMLCLARVKNPVLYFVSPPSRFITCRVLDRRMIGTLHG